MLIEPNDLSATIVADAVSGGWGFEIARAQYAPVGFGSHHWSLLGLHGEQWFATVDDLRLNDRPATVLTGALTTARVLRDRGLGFVVAPLPRPSGQLTVALSASYVLAVYPYVDGEIATYGPYESHKQRKEVIARLVDLHRATSMVEHVAPIDDMKIPKRDGLEEAMRTRDKAWNSGPLAGDAQRLLTDNSPALQRALAAYDTLAGQVRATHDHWVVTHGEPHRANTIRTSEGVQLIDWETARLAPRERDLWALIAEDAQTSNDYCEAGGVELDQAALDLYRRWWDLCEVSLYTDDLRRPHTDNPETRIAEQGLRKHLLLAVRHGAVDDSRG